jgi:aromatic ring-opening dioxygenase catalytic subunit (LigB family)
LLRANAYPQNSVFSHIYNKVTTLQTNILNNNIMLKRASSFFVPHGGGPMPLLNDPSHQQLIEFLSNKGRKIISENKPKAIILVTAHWEEAQPTISSAPQHELYYDYYGFPRETYNIKYPAPGHPEVAKQVFDLLKNAGFQPKLDPKRGWDHGVFVPLKLLVPEADIPIVQLSVLRSQDPESHIKMGQALAPLRDENVAIVGSGMTFHNMSELRKAFSGKQVNNAQFDQFLEDACTSAEPVRSQKLIEWEKAPGAHHSHPKDAAEHLIPLFVVAGAGGEAPGKRVLDWSSALGSQAAYLWE